MRIYILDKCEYIPMNEGRQGSGTPISEYVIRRCSSYLQDQCKISSGEGATNIFLALVDVMRESGLLVYPRVHMHSDANSQTNAQTQESDATYTHRET